MENLETGIYVVGGFIGSEISRRTDNDGKEAISTIVGVSMGLRSVVVYFDGRVDIPYKLGEIAVIRCRPYVNRRGQIVYVAGEFVI